MVTADLFLNSHGPVDHSPSWTLKDFFVNRDGEKPGRRKQSLLPPGFVSTPCHRLASGRSAVWTGMSGFEPATFRLNLIFEIRLLSDGFTVFPHVCFWNERYEFITYGFVKTVITPLKSSLRWPIDRPTFSSWIQNESERKRCESVREILGRNFTDRGGFGGIFLKEKRKREEVVLLSKSSPSGKHSNPAF